MNLWLNESHIENQTIFLSVLYYSECPTRLVTLPCAEKQGLLDDEKVFI